MTTPKRHYLEHAPFRLLRMWLQEKEIYFVAGANSIFVPSRQEKYIQLNRPDGSLICRDWEDEKGERVLMTPGEAARSELKKTFPGLKRVGWSSGHISLFDWRWPMLFTGACRGSGMYFDLKGAYHQIYRRLWLDTAFPCGYGSLSLMTIADTLSEWKQARNSLVGVCAGRTVIGVKGYKSIKMSTSNPFLSPGLWATIQAILNEIAFEAERCGAVYIATDGYIFPAEKGGQHFEEFLIGNGLLYRSARGKYDIAGWGAYKVRGKTTGLWHRMEKVKITSGLRSISLADARYPTKLTRWWSKSISRYSQARWQGGIKECQKY